MHPLLAWALEAALSALAPPRCAACDEPVSTMVAFCAACASQMEPLGPMSAGAIAAFAYGGPVTRALARCKYEDRPDLARPLGDLLWRAVEPWAATLRDACVVPVPLHPERLAERGFNQSALLATRIAPRLGAPFAPRALVRTSDSTRQATLDRRARARNAARAFLVRAPRQVQGRPVLLVDDVRTTGATLDACTLALLAAGATHVGWAVVALADRHR